MDIVNDRVMQMLMCTYAPPEIYYYKNGNEYIARTGGWGFVTARGTPQTAKNADNMEITCRESDDAVGYVWTINTVDLTGVNTIQIYMDGIIPSSSDAIKVGINDTRSSNSISAFSTAGTIFTTSFIGQTAEIDVSAVSGAWYIGIYVLNSSMASSGNVNMKVYWVKGLK